MCKLCQSVQPLTQAVSELCKIRTCTLKICVIIFLSEWFLVEIINSFVTFTLGPFHIKWPRYLSLLLVWNSQIRYYGHIVWRTMYEWMKYVHRHISHVLTKRQVLHLISNNVIWYSMFANDWTTILPLPFVYGIMLPKTVSILWISG